MSLQRCLLYVIKWLLSTKNIEVYALKESLYGIVKFYMILIDFRRKSKLKYFPHLKGMAKKDFFLRDNYIQGIILYNNNITDSDKETTYEIASGFLDNKDNCDWSMRFIQYDFDFEKLKNIQVNNEELIIKIRSILDLLELEYEVKLENIDLNQ